MCFQRFSSLSLEFRAKKVLRRTFALLLGSVVLNELANLNKVNGLNLERGMNCVMVLVDSLIVIFKKLFQVISTIAQLLFLMGKVLLFRPVLYGNQIEFEFSSRFSSVLSLLLRETIGKGFFKASDSFSKPFPLQIACPLLHL